MAFAISVKREALVLNSTTQGDEHATNSTMDLAKYKDDVEDYDNVKKRTMARNEAKMWLIFGEDYK